MANRQLQGKEFIDPKFFDKYVQGAKESIEVTKALTELIKSGLGQKSKEIKLITPKSVKDIENFNKQVKETRTQIDQLTKVEAKELELQKELSRLKNDPVYKKQVLEVERLRQEKQTLNKVTREQVKDERSVKNEYDRQSRLLNKLRKEYKNVALAKGENSKEAKKLLKELQPLDKKLKDIDRTAGQGQRTIGIYERALQGFRKTAGSFLAIGGTILASVAGIFKFDQINKEIDKVKFTVKTLFKETEKGISVITKKSMILAKVYDKDVNEVLKASNSLSKEFGISAINSLNLIETGIKKGADVNGQFLDNLSEYSTQFRLAGISAEESIAIITQQVKQGVFSDKGIDAIKEATVSLREMTPATQTALKNIGLSAEVIRKEIKSGSKTYFDVIQEIVSKTNEFGDKSQEAGVILADVFRGAGEDAGKFIFSLDKIDKSLSNMEDSLTDSQKASNNLATAWENFKLSFISSESVLGRGLTNLKNNLSGILNQIKRLTSTTKGVGGDALDKAFEKGTIKYEKQINIFKSFIGKTNEELKVIYKESSNQEKKFLQELAKQRKAGVKDSIILEKYKIKEINKAKEKQSEYQLKLVKAIEDGDKKQSEYFGAQVGFLNAKIASYEKETEVIKKTNYKKNKFYEKELTHLKELQDELKKTQEKKEKLLVNPKDELTPQFKKLKKEAEKLKEEIKLLTDILNGKKRDGDTIEIEELRTPPTELVTKKPQWLIDQQEKEKKEKKFQERLEEIKKTGYKNLNSLAENYAIQQKERSNERLEDSEREIIQSQKRADALRKIATEGNLSAQQSLAIEQKREAQARLQKEKEIKKQKQIEAGLAMLKTYTTALSNGKSTEQALADVLKNGTLLTGLINALPSFYDGTEDTGTTSNPLDSKGGRLAVIHDNERYVPKKINNHLKGISNSELPKMASFYKQGLIKTNITSNNWQSNEDILSKFDEMKNEIKNLGELTKNNIQFDFDNVENTLKKTIKHGNRIDNLHTKKSILWD